MSKALMFLSLMLLLCSLGAAERSVFFTEDFSSNQFPPEGWSISDHAENWTIVQTALSGGVVPELKFGWYPIFTGSSYIISPEIDTQNTNNLHLDFRQYYDYHDPGPNLKVLCRSGGGAWTTAWSSTPVTNLAPFMYTVDFSGPDLGSSTFQFAFCFEGFSFNVDGWFLDDIRLYKIDTSDLTLTEALPDSQVTVGTAVNPYCVIRNQGEYSITARASMQIFVNDSLSESWPNFVTHNMTPQEELRVDFPSFSASVPNASYRVKYTVSSQEGTIDDNPSNNEQFSHINTWAVPKQKVLLELGTGIWNADLNGCYGAIQGAEELLQNGYPVAILNHMSGPPYACDDSEARIIFYNMTHLPTAVFDGQYFSEASSSASSLYGTYLPLYEAAAGLKAPFSMELRGAYSAGTYDFQVLFDKSAYTDSLQAVVHLVLSQNSMYANWMGLSHLDHVTMDFVPDTNGSLITVPNAATDFRFNLSQFVGLDFWPANYIITAFVQDAESKRVIQCQSELMGPLLPPVANNDPLENQALTQMKLWPNPFRNELRLDFVLPKAQKHECQIFNLRGQLVRNYSLNSDPGLKQSLTWDGKDSAGASLPAGVYFVKLNTDSGAVIQKALLLR